MNLFDEIVNQALSQNTELTSLRVVVEKELLHHDILLAMSDAGLLQNLCFIGGTCLRACYGSNRLSEDLDFTGGTNFKRETLTELKTVLVDKLQKKYGLVYRSASLVKKRAMLIRGNCKSKRGLSVKTCQLSALILISVLFPVISHNRASCSTLMA